ncbi:MAG: hypothetical protein ABIH11_08750 [Candidatus Altiarchaeota archaeon]
MSSVGEQAKSSVKSLGRLFAVIGLLYGLLGAYLFHTCFARVYCSITSNILFLIFIPQGILSVILGGITSGAMAVDAAASAIVFGLLGFAKGTIIQTLYFKYVHKQAV